MAHYKRGKSRVQSSPHISRRSTGSDWLSHWPRWWDILYHTRPRRRAEHELEDAVLKGRRDPDGIAWPSGNSKPHKYYW